MGSGRLCCISFLFKKWREGEREREERKKTVMQLDDMTDREKNITGRQGERE